MPCLCCSAEKRVLLFAEPSRQGQLSQTQTSPLASCATTSFQIMLATGEKKVTGGAVRFGSPAPCLLCSQLFTIACSRGNVSFSVRWPKWKDQSTAVHLRLEMGIWVSTVGLRRPPGCHNSGLCWRLPARSSRCCGAQEVVCLPRLRTPLNRTRSH